MYSEQILQIVGYEERTVPNTFLRQDAGSDRLAIVFPGYASSVDTPLLYYATELLLDCGCDILLVQYDYRGQQEFQLPLGSREHEWIESDALAAVGASLSQRTYRELILIGQSLGTVALAGVLGFDWPPLEARCIWLAPLLQYSSVYERILQERPRSLLVVGEEDRSYDRLKVENLVDVLNAESLVIGGARHDLQIPSQLRETMRVHERLLDTVARFIDCREFF